MQEGEVLATMVGHTDRVNCVQWLPTSGELHWLTTPAHIASAESKQIISQVLAYLVW